MKDASDSCDESPGQPCHQSPPRLTPNERFAARQAIPLRRTLTRGIAMRHHLLLASGLALLLAACGDRQPEQPATTAKATPRSEEHTSELQSLMRISYAVFCLKKKTIYTRYTLKTRVNNLH